MILPGAGAVNKGRISYSSGSGQTVKNLPICASYAFDLVLLALKNVYLDMLCSSVREPEPWERYDYTWSQSRFF